MSFIHRREHLAAGDRVVLDCDTQCNFMLTDDANFAAFKAGRQFEYFGGKFEKFPAQIVAPRTGDWNITIDLGGGDANIRYWLSTIRAS